MSGEFGGYANGYLWAQMEGSAEDCLGSNHELVRMWGQVLQEICPIMKAICWFEACDSGLIYPIEESIRQIPKIEEALSRIRQDVGPIQRLIEDASRRAIEDYLKNNPKE